MNRSPSPENPHAPRSQRGRRRLRPNRHALGLFAMLLAMWYAGASQNNMAVFMLGFVLASLAAVSLVHAWANLRDVSLGAAHIEPVFAGQTSRVTLHVQADPTRARAHFGLLVEALGTGICAGIGSVGAQQPRHGELLLPAPRRGRFEGLRLRLRSIYPLGFFTTLRTDFLAQPFFVYPQAEGNLALPRTGASKGQAREGGKFEGDDYSGTRLYRRGESQRHIDWKAAARGQPLLLKQWTADDDGPLCLDWKLLGALDHEARLSQLARWIVLAEREGLAYSVRLPRMGALPAGAQAEDAGFFLLPAAQGPTHFHHCLEVLAAFATDPAAEPRPARAREAAPRKPRRTWWFRTGRSTLQNVPLMLNCAALLMAAVPLSARLSPWTTALFLGSLALRITSNVRHWRLPPLPLKVLLLAGGLAGVFIAHGTLLGIDPGLEILFLLLALKLLETNSVHDFQVLSLLGWFIALCGLFFSQDLGTWLYIGAVGLLLITAIARFHSDSGPGLESAPAAPKRHRLASIGALWKAWQVGPALRLALVMSLQALPLVLLLFAFFPRSYTGFQFKFSSPISSPRGMSEKMEPGSVANLALSNAPAFRAEFPDHNMPPTRQLYWRAGVLWGGDGLTWVRDNPKRAEAAFSHLGGALIRQRIMVEPHGSRWIFALDQPATAVPKTTLEPGGYLRSTKIVDKSLRYEVSSRLENRETALLPEHRQVALRLPKSIEPRVQALVDGWCADAQSEREIVDKALHYFATEQFLYTLNPGRYSRDGLGDFLFVRRSGFCEHYAGAFATLMRIAHLPARVVIGFHGGEFNRMGNYVLVRQCDAHAWCEVWLKERGWLRVDPVDVIAPGRLQDGLASYLESGGPNADEDSLAAVHHGADRFLGKLRQLWDSVSYEWDLRVLSFDDETQYAFLSLLGLNDQGWGALLLWPLGIAAFCLGATAFWLRRPRPPTPADRIAREYARFCRWLASAGLPRPAHEGPLDFTRRAATRFPAHAQSIERIGQLYIGMRYSPHPGTLEDFAREVRAQIRQKPGV